MDTHDLVERLSSLVQMDVDAVDVYDEVLRHVTDPDVATAFQRFRGEHAFHVSALRQSVARLGGSAEEPRVDLMGKVAELVSGLRSRGGTRGALHAMDTAERYHNRRYREAAEWEIEDVEVRTFLRRFLDDEERHLAFIEAKLGERVSAR